MTPEGFVDYFRWASPRLSLLFGLGFLVANLRLVVELLQYRRRRRHALLVWEGTRPKYYGLNLALGAVFGILLAVNVFYLHRPVMEVVLPDHLRAVFYSSSDVYFIMAEDEYDSVKDRLPVDTYVLARQQMFDLKPRNFLDGSELPRFVLVSNRD